MDMLDGVTGKKQPARIRLTSKMLDAIAKDKVLVFKVNGQEVRVQKA